MDTQTQTPFDQPVIPWQGFHHIAIVTPDLDATIHFYRDILGMTVSDIMDRRGKHCFIRPGGETWGLHVFEYAEAQIFSFPTSMHRFVMIPGALQHIAFALPDEATALSLKTHLNTQGIETTGINDLGSIRNFLFLDNIGNMLEATWPNA